MQYILHQTPSFGDLWKLTWSKQSSRSLRLDCPCHESWVAVHAGINLPTWDIFERGDVWSKSLVIVDLKTDRCNRSWDLLVALQSISKACVTSCGWGWVSRFQWANECVCGQQECPMQRKSNASTLKKKQYALAYHYVWEGVAWDEWRTALREYWWKCGWLVY